jgi:LysM repeat protein
MKKINTSCTLILSISGLLLTGCATSRPPRQGRSTVPVNQNVRPVQRVDVVDSGGVGVIMPPAYNPGTGNGIEVIEPIQVEQIPSMNVPPVTNQVKVQPKTGTPYTIKKGESLSSIAARNRMSWKKLADYNLISNPNKVRVGQVILIPDSGSSAARTTPAANTPTSPRVEITSGKTYVVQSGDSLSVIAQRYGTKVSALKSVNNLVSDKLLVGQVLKLPEGAEASGSNGASSTQVADRQPASRPTPVATRPIPPRPTPTPVALDVDPEDSPDDLNAEDPVSILNKPYPIIVAEGDTLESIAKNYIATVEEIRKLNNLKEGDEVKPGQKLMMPATLF